MIDILLPFFLLGLLVAYLGRLPKTLVAQTKRSHRLSSSDDGWTLELTRRSVSIYTTAYNTLPVAIVRSWSSEAKLLYDVGSFAAALGLLCACGGAFWAAAEVWKTVWYEVTIHAIQKGAAEEAISLGTRAKRAFEQAAAVHSSNIAPPSGGLQPLIPGVTMPLSHFPTLVLVVVVNQLIHEMGHALSAALDGISPARLSLSVYLALPSMLVSFPSSVDNLSPPAKMRLAASGPWHNLLTFLILATASFVGGGGIFWADISANGRAIETVAPHSPLADHLGIGMVVTHVDDIALGGYQDKWGSYLDSNVIADAGYGWCVDKESYNNQPPPACDAQSGIRFVHALPSSTFGLEEHCMPAFPFLQSPPVPCPCPMGDLVCVRPSPEEKILRIELEGKSLKGDKVVIFAGDRKEVLRDVQVGHLAPRLVPPLVLWGTMFIEYMKLVALSLFLFNLLPLPYMDGAQFLSALLASTTHQPPPRHGQSVFGQRSEFDTYMAYELHDDNENEHLHQIEQGGWDSRREEDWKRRLRRGVEVLLTAALAAWVGGWAMLALLRSS